MSDIEILPMGSHEFAVTVAESDVRTVHRVRVPDDLRALVPGTGETDLVRESVEVLLERRLVTELPRDFSLGWAANQVPELMDEVRVRLS